MREYKRVTIRSRSEWRTWLEANHESTESIWLVTYKRTSGGPHVSYADIVEEALCFGWIDSRPATLDEKRSMLLLSPRRKGSAWSKLNKTRIERLIADALMTPAGLAKIEQAKSDGSWSLLDDVEAMIIPPDLAAALDASPPAAENWHSFPPSARRGILHWIKSAKKPETRARRVGETVALAEKNIRARFAKTAG